MIDRATKDVVWSGNEPHWGGQHDAQFLENGNLLLGQDPEVAGVLLWIIITFGCSNLLWDSFKNPCVN